MKFSRRSKYFLRGMGFGILVTVVIFSVALVFYEPKNSSETANDTAVTEEIKQEENTVEEKVDENTVEEKVEEKTEEKEEKNPELSEKNSSEDTAETEDSKTTETKTPSKTVSFKVTAGESSYKVAENLFRAGLIDDPNKFNTYLEQNGYDNTIHVGSFNIPEGSTYEQIANTISK